MRKILKPSITIIIIIITISSRVLLKAQTIAPHKCLISLFLPSRVFTTTTTIIIIIIIIVIVIILITKLATTMNRPNIVLILILIRQVFLFKKLISDTGDVDLLDVDTSGASWVIVSSTRFNVLHWLTLSFGSRQLAEQSSEVTAAKRVNYGGLSHAAVAE